MFLKLNVGLLEPDGDWFPVDFRTRLVNFDNIVDLTECELNDNKNGDVMTELVTIDGDLLYAKSSMKEIEEALRVVYKVRDLTIEQPEDQE